MTRIIDYDGVTVDHLVPAGGPHPEELQINIIGVENPVGPVELTYMHESAAGSNGMRRIIVDKVDLLIGRGSHLLSA